MISARHPVEAKAGGMSVDEALSLLLSAISLTLSCVLWEDNVLLDLQTYFRIIGCYVLICGPLYVCKDFCVG